MFQISRGGIHVRVDLRNNGCRLELRGRLTGGHEADEACTATALDRLLGDLMEAGTRHFEIDISGLKEIDISGVQALHRLRNRAGCTLIIPANGMKFDPLLTVEMLTRFDWRTGMEWHRSPSEPAKSSSKGGPMIVKSMCATFLYALVLLSTADAAMRPLFIRGPATREGVPKIDCQDVCAILRPPKAPKKPKPPKPPNPRARARPPKRILWAPVELVPASDLLDLLDLLSPPEIPPALPERYSLVDWVDASQQLPTKPLTFKERLQNALKGVAGGRSPSRRSCVRGSLTDR